MKRFFSAFIAAVLIAVSAGSICAAESAVSVELDNEKIVFDGQMPVIVDGRTLIPLRGVFEKMGYTITWEGKTKTAILKSDKSEVSVTANSAEFKVNGESRPLDVPARIMNGSMMLPLRAVGEAAGTEVTWNGAEKTVIIDTKAANVSDIVKTSDYLVSYAKTVEPLDGVKPLFTELKGLDGEITVTELQSYRVKLYSAGQTVTAVREAAERLEVPDNMAELHSVRLKSIDKLNETIERLVDYCDGKISDDELTKKVNAIAAEVDELNRRNNSIIESIETK